MLEKQSPFFLNRPIFFLDFWIKVIVPSFSALFSYSTWEVVCNRSPLLRTIFLDEKKDKLIFLWCPRSFNQSWIQNFLPSMKTLDICSSIEVLSNLFPIFGLVFLNSILKQAIFFWSPMALCF